MKLPDALEKAELGNNRAGNTQRLLRTTRFTKPASNVGVLESEPSVMLFSS
jgi:hypothetical protein